MNEYQFTAAHKPFASKISITTKIYIWSIILEPMLFFVVAAEFYGISTNISRLLQFIFLLLFCIKNLLFLEKRWFLPSPMSARYRWYLIYFMAAIFSALYGFLSKAYDIPFLSNSETTFVRVYRPIFEYFIAVYYFCYFVILARYVLISKQAIDYFFSLFKKIFFFSLIFGLMDILIQLFVSGYDGIPRHIGDGRTAPMRYHGIAGEPRDAFAFLIYGLGVLWIKDVWNNEKKLTKNTIFLVVIAALLSQSASGLLGLLFSSIILFIFFYIPRMSFSKLFNFFILSILMIVILVLGVNSSPRLMLYFEASKSLYNVLESGNQVTSVLEVAMNNIYPLWVRWTEILELNLLPLFIGTGLGSSSVANIIYFGENELQNTNSNLVRTLYENGIIGTFFLILAFLNPIRLFPLPLHIRNKWLVYMIFILGAFFAHRTANPFIFLGVSSAIFAMIINKASN